MVNGRRESVLGTLPSVSASETTLYSPVYIKAMKTSEKLMK